MNRWLQNEYVLRVISVLLGIILWGAVTQALPPFQAETNSSKKVENVELEAVYDHNQMEIVSRIPKVDVTLKGDAFLLEHIPENYRVYVDLKGYAAGTHQDVPVRVEGLPLGIRAEVTPAKVTVKLERKAKKILPVETSNNLPSNVVSLFSPDRVEVSGRSSLVNQVIAVRAQVPENFSERSGETTVPLQAYGKNGPIKEVKLSPAKVKLRVAHADREMPLTVRIAKNPPPGYQVESITYFPKTVRVIGNPEQVNNFTSYLGPLLDLSEVTSNKSFLLKIPLRTGVQKVAPQEVEVYVKITRVEDTKPVQPEEKPNPSPEQTPEPNPGTNPNPNPNPDQETTTEPDPDPDTETTPDPETNEPAPVSKGKDGKVFA